MVEQARKAGDRGLMYPKHDGQRGALAVRPDQDAFLSQSTGPWLERVAERSQESAAVRKGIDRGVQDLNNHQE
jgi:hypothetical protein